MFEGLKESLGRFRDDVEEEVEEAEEAEEAEDVEEVDGEVEDVEETGEADGESGGGPDEQSEGENPGSAEVPETGAETAGDDVEAAADADGATDADGPTDEVSAAAAPDQGEAPHADEPAEGGVAADEGIADGEAADEGDPGFVQRAKSMATGKVYIDEEDLEDPLWDLEMALLENDVAMDVAEDLLDQLREELTGERKAITTRTGSVVEDALYDALLSVLSVGQFDFEERIADLVEEDPPAVVIFTGVNGVGKTTTIAKVSRYLAERGYSSVLANGDTYRAGANEQIEEHADRLDRKLITHERGGDPAAVIYDAVEYAEANDVDVVLGDTAGRLHTDEGLMDQLEKIDRVVGPDLTIFVDESVAGQDAVERAKEFDSAAEVDGAVLTKADADASGGAAISVAHVTGKPVLFLGVGQGYDDLERFDPEELVERLLAE